MKSDNRQPISSHDRLTGFKEIVFGWYKVISIHACNANYSILSVLFFKGTLLNTKLIPPATFTM